MTNSHSATAGATHVIQHAEGDVKFGAYLYQEFSDCSTVQNVGMCLPELQEVCEIVLFQCLLFSYMLLTDTGNGLSKHSLRNCSKYFIFHMFVF